MYDENRARFREILTAQASIRGLPVALMIHGDSTVVERADVDPSGAAQVPTNLSVRQATVQRPIIYFSDDADFVAAVMPLAGFDDTYLYVARPIDPKVLQYLRMTEAGLAEYSSMEDRRFGVQVAFALMYAVIALILLLSSVWLGLNFANWLAAPIRRLISAADLVASGNLNVKVPLRRSEGDLANLSESFNKMTQELRSQHEDIIGARDQIDQRRRFTEAVLSGVGAGVVGLDTKGRVTIINRSAEQLLNHSEADLIGVAIGEQIPEIAPLAARGARRRRARARHDQARARRTRTHDQRAGYDGSLVGVGTRLRGHARRHHRACFGATNLGLGRCRAAHRARDQEPADPHSVVGGAPAAQIRKGARQRPRDLRAMHANHHPPGRRYRKNGRRVFDFRPHAEAGGGDARISPKPSGRWSS